MLKVIVLGSSGTVGSSFLRVAHEFPDLQIDSLTRSDVDFLDMEGLTSKLKIRKPNLILNCAGKVAGVEKNSSEPLELITSNSLSSISIATAALNLESVDYIYMSPACVYPTNLNAGSTPDDLWKSSPEKTSLGYASSKLMGIELIKAINLQYKRDWKIFIPTNLFGPMDWIHGSTGHVISMLTTKFLDATNHNLPQVEVWGTGSVLRDFLYTDDFARATLALWSKSRHEIKEITNFPGYGEVNVAELAHLIAKKVGYSGKIQFNVNKPEGAKRKLLVAENQVSKLYTLDLESALANYIAALTESYKT